MSARRPSALLVGALVAGLAVAACGGGTASPTPAGSPSAAPAVTPAPASPSAPAATETPTASPSEAASEAPSQASTGGGRIEIAEEKVAVTVPDDWNQVVLTEDDIDTILDAYPEGAFTAEQVAQMKAAVGSGMKLMAFDGEGTGTNLNLLVQPTPVPISMLEPVLVGQLEAIPGTSGIEVDKGEVDGEDALLVTYAIDQDMGNGQAVKMSGYQVYASANDRLYVFTLSVTDGASVDAQAILDSIEFLD